MRDDPARRAVAPAAHAAPAAAPAARVVISAAPAASAVAPAAREAPAARWLRRGGAAAARGADFGWRPWSMTMGAGSAARVDAD